MSNDSQGLDPDRMVVLSFKPRFAHAILAGVKTVELRRTVPKIVIPTRALLYAASPVRALLDTASSLASAPLISQPYGTSMAHDRSCPTTSSRSISRAWMQAPL